MAFLRRFIMGLAFFAILGKNLDNEAIMPLWCLSLFFLADMVLAHTYFWYLANSSICIYLATFFHTSSRSNANFLHRPLTKGHSRNVIIKWCIATAGSKFQIFNVTFLKRSMNVRNGPFFSYCMLMRATNVRWWGWLVANCVPKRAIRVSNESTELRGSCVN